MGLLSAFYVGELFTQGWVDALKGAPERGMAAKIKIYDPKTTTTTYNPVSGKITSTPTVLYEGKARVQPVRSAKKAVLPGNNTYSQTVLFSIPIDKGKLLDLRPKLRVEVTEATLNPKLTKYLFALSEVLDSSNPIERTFYATTNLESVVV